MTCESCADCCPEVVAVTVSTTTISISGSTAEVIVEETTATGGETTLTLGHTPIDGYAVKVWRNGLLMRPTTDWTRSGATISFVGFLATAGDVYQCEYAYEVT